MKVEMQTAGGENTMEKSTDKDVPVCWSKTERGLKAEERLQKHPYDTESWGILIREAQGQPMDISRVLYERLVRRFPNAGRYWRLYIEQEMKHQNFEQVEKLFQRCLMKVLNIDLWKTYLSYVKEAKSSMASYREKMTQAYEFALDKMGIDFNSYQIWVDYIAFLKAGEAIGSYAENMKITAIRRVYQRSVVTPIITLEAIWREYNTYEQSINKNLAKNLINDRTRDYMNARRVSKEYEAITRGLVRGNPSIPPQGTADEGRQLQIWKRYIVWEKSNPLRTEDISVITKRVMFAFEQCLQSLGFNPDIWYEAALYLETVSKALSDKGDTQGAKVLSEETATLYERAITSLMKHNMLLYFAYADFEESRMKFSKAKEIYEKFLALENTDRTLAYIQYMKFARRSEGIKESRIIFKRAREDANCGFHVYIAAALMEYYCSKDKGVAFKIFELGLKKHINEPEYVLAYVDFLSHLNDDNNTRVLFEKVLTTMPKEQARNLHVVINTQHELMVWQRVTKDPAMNCVLVYDVWSRFLEFESTSGDLASILKVEKRRLHAYREELQGCEAAVVVDRYKYMDLYPCSPVELKIMGYVGSTRHSSSTPHVVGAAPTDQFEQEEEKIISYPQPDITQMTPFKPTAGVVGVHSVPGGVFPVPPAAAHLLTLMPPPACFQGPFVIIDDLIRLLSECHLPENQPSGLPVQTDGHTNGVEGHSDEKTDSDQQKRGVKRPNKDHDSDDESASVTPPVNDIYRSRQQKRVH